MANYQEMYRQLFTAQTEAIEILQKAQQRTEDMFIDSPDPALLILDTAIAEKSEEGYSPNTLPQNKQEGDT